MGKILNGPAPQPGSASAGPPLSNATDASAHLLCDNVTRDEIVAHYLREDVERVIRTWATDGDACRAGMVADPTPPDGGSPPTTWHAVDAEQLRLLNLADSADYRHLVTRRRTLHGTLNLFAPEVFEDRMPLSRRDEDGNPTRLGDFSGTLYLTLGADWDLQDKKRVADPDVLATLEAALTFTANELREVAPQSVHVCFSGAGGYVYLHHRLLGDELATLPPAFRERALRNLTTCWNAYLPDIERRFFEKTPEAREHLKLDALVNSKRVFKAPLSVHKRFPFAVLPLDAHEPRVRLEDARLPLRGSVVERAASWYHTWDEDAAPFFERLQKYADKTRPAARAYSAKPRAPVIAASATRPPPVDAFPPCIRNLINGVDRHGASLAHKDGRLRALATVTNWLYSMSWTRDDARSLVNQMAQRIGHAHGFPLFDASWGRVSASSCETIQRKGDAYPKLGLGEFDVCAPDDACPIPFGKAPRRYVVPRAHAAPARGDGA